MKMLWALCVALSVSVTAEQKLRNCNEVRAAFTSKGLNVNDVPNKGVHGECPPPGTNVGTRNLPGSETGSFKLSFKLAELALRANGVFEFMCPFHSFMVKAGVPLEDNISLHVLNNSLTRFYYIILITV